MRSKIQQCIGILKTGDPSPIQFQKSPIRLYNHGLLTLGETVSAAFTRLYYLEQACKVQLDVMQTGRPIKMPSPEVCEHTARQWETGMDGLRDRELPEWPAYLRMLDRQDPSYRE